ncbi:MAG: ABC transporter ATP-binding protein [Clostridiales bacterium]|nr:ABC transporter ATP-binding protein [Clostridiales bacterium]
MSEKKDIMLEVQDLTIRFGGLVAVNSVNFQIPKGAIFGLIGPNGAGKPTLFNMVGGVYKPTSGKVIFDGEEIQGRPAYWVAARGIARTYQNINLFKSMTVLENVMVGCHSRTSSGLAASIFRTGKQRKEEMAVREKCREILEFMDLGDKVDYRASNLSYGEQRRLEISRALAADPKLLLLDEPAAGMNGAEKEELQQTVRKIADRGITVLLVEHDMKLVMNVTHQICVISFGKRIGYGTPDEIQKDPVVVEAYLGGGLDV